MPFHKSNNSPLNRRDFCKATLAASLGVTLGTSASAGEKSDPAQNGPVNPPTAEWRNQQDSMAYRMFGKTGMMVSEIVQGTALWESQNHLDAFAVAFEKGVNYIDASPAYRRRKSEKLVGQYLKDTGNRDRIFLSNKISFYDEYMVKLMNDVLNSLPGEKRKALRKQADALVEERGVLKPGYHIYYWPKQADKLYISYMRHVVFREYGGLRKLKSQIKKHMHQLVEDSLRTVGTDYFDVLHCPHGVAMPELLESDNIREVLAELKASGKIRFSALSMHNDVAGNLAKALALGYYDAAMVAYNIANQASLEAGLTKAGDQGMGIVAMKVANVINGENNPSWRLEKLNAAIGEQPFSRHAKAYLWALQNPNVSCCVSDMVTPQMVAENTSVVGRKTSLNAV